MGEATVFEYAWPKASILPWYNPTCHFVSSTPSLPTCMLLRACVFIGSHHAPGQLLLADPQGGSVICPAPGTRAQTGSSRRTER